MRKITTLSALLLAAVLVFSACNDTTVTTELEGASASESPSEPVTFPRLVCKEGQWFLETGICEEDLPEPNHWSPNIAATFDSYEDFVRRIKEVDFTEEQMDNMKALMIYYYGGYQENGALPIPDPTLLESFSFPFLGDSAIGFEPEMSTVYWGLSEGIGVYPSNHRGPGRAGDDHVVIHEKDDYNRWFKYLEEEWEKGFFKTANTKEDLGLTMYVVDEHTWAYRTETESFTAWIEREFGVLYLHVKEKNGLSYSYVPDTYASDGRVLEQIKAVFEKYGYELGE